MQTKHVVIMRGGYNTGPRCSRQLFLRAVGCRSGRDCRKRERTERCNRNGNLRSNVNEDGRNGHLLAGVNMGMSLSANGGEVSNLGGSDSIAVNINNRGSERESCSSEGGEEGEGTHRWI